MLDYLEEILSTLKQNKLRAIMPGFRDAQGIFMLIILLGSGKALQNGMEFNLRNIANNAIQNWRGRTSLEHEGLTKGRRVQFTNEVVELLHRKVSGIEDLTGRLYLWSEVPITYKSEYSNYTVTCITPAFYRIQRQNLIKGRFIKDRKRRRVGKEC